MRTLLLAVIGSTFVAMPTGGGRSILETDFVPRSSSGVQYALPVPAPPVVIEPFRAPTSRFGPGHRGVDLATPRAGPVWAAADGVVRFAGRVAGRDVVVVAHADGITTEYEPLRPAVRAGDRVPRGGVLGTVSGMHGRCPPDRCLHWAARHGDTYLDPMTLLTPLGVVRLVPWSR
jgi:murein DD-endopeptidase MepM/ murein hydrolase activator NlpD